MARDDFFAWIWREFSPAGLIGVHEGSLLSEEASQQGLEPESWTVDSGEAPRERDWVGVLARAKAQLYFKTREGAKSTAEKLALIPELEVGGVEEQKAQDWDAEWKASFTGVKVKPFWDIIPPWTRVLRLNPGAGFGTGTHETTQLCLEAIGEMGSLEGKKVLDFGSGSGILAVAAALLGAQVDAVEIDPLAIDNATENAGLNQMQARIRFARELRPAATGYDLIIANILRPVLLEFAERLVSRLRPDGALILSGLIESDVAQVTERYQTLLRARQGSLQYAAMQLAEWRALVWK